MLKKFIFLIISILLLNSSFAQETITREERCQIAQQNLEKLSDISKPIYGRTADGKIRELTYQEIVNARQENQDLVNSLCSVSVQPSVNPQYETKAAILAGNSNTSGLFGFANRARGQAQALSGSHDSVSVSLRNALLMGDWGEVEIILRYVIGLDENLIEIFIATARSSSVDEAVKIFNEQFRNKADSSNDSNSKGSPLPVPEPTTITTDSGEKLTYKSNSKHTPGQPDNRPNAGTEPRNSLDLFKKSVAFKNGKTRYAVDSKGNVHRFGYSNDGTYHWNGSSGDLRNPLNIHDTSAKSFISILKKMGAKKFK